MADHQPASRQNWGSLGVFLLSIASLLCLVRLVGCGTGMPRPQTAEAENSESGDASSSAASDPSAAEILKRMIATYQQTTTYRDQGKLHLNFIRNGRRTEQSWDVAVQFVRPGQLRVDAYNLHLASDAQSPDKQLIARVDDPVSNDIDNQIVVRPAPETISLESLADDPVLYSQLTGRFPGPPVQLELLLAAKPLEGLFVQGVQLEQLQEASVDEHTCHRIQATASEGKFVFWVDRETSLLRRVQYPAKAFLPDLASDPLVSEAELVADMEQATFSPAEKEFDFALAIPRDAKQVRAFVLPPVSPHSDALGKPVSPFEFALLSGGKLNPETLKGKVTAFLWYAHHPVCEGPLKEFSAVAERLNDQVALYAICTEPTDVSDKAVRDQLKAWKVDLTPARDLKEFRSRVFEVRDLPAVTLLDAEGRLQWVESGPAAVAELPKAMERLLNGADLAAETREKERLLREQYERLIASGGPQIDTGLAPASSPSKLKLQEAWKLADLPSPGGVLAVDAESDSARILVVADLRTVWEVATDGQVVAKHQLDLPENAQVTALRSWANKDGKRYYAAFAPAKPGVYVFDEQWKRLFVYPAEETESLDVRDVQIGDLNNDGTPVVLVAFTESAGLHAVSLEGKRLWSNRAYAPLLSVAISHEIPERGRLAYMTGRGGISTVNRYGHEEPARNLPNWTLAHLFTARFAKATQAAYVGVGVNPVQEPCIVGITSSLSEAWNVPLSGSSLKQPIDFVVSGQLRKDSQGEWLVGWGDGVITIVSENGEFDDTFATGKEIRGIAVARAKEKPLIFVTTVDDVTAWSVEE